MADLQPASRQVLTIIVASLAFSVLIYVGITYLVPVNPTPGLPAATRTALLAIAVVTTIAIPTIERMLLDRGKGPAAVQTAAVAAGALSEVGAVLGLLYYLLAGRREWIFFVLSGIAFARLLLRLPEYYRLMDEKR